jgi:hypothetical protein
VLFRVFLFLAVDALASLCPGKELIDKRLIGPRSRSGRFGEENHLASFARSVGTASTELYRRPSFERFVTTFIYIKLVIKCLYISFGLFFYCLRFCLSTDPLPANEF